MWLIPGLCYAFLLAFTVLAIQFHINLSKYAAYLTVPTVLAVYIPISIIILLPIDYTKHNFDVISWFDLSDDTILVLWRCTYWITFLLTWLLLPMVQEYYRSGYYDKVAKLKDAFRQNLKFQLAMLAISVVTMFYLTFEVGLSFGHLKSMVIGLTHIYSLILALWLMAHGLIAIPRHRWTEGNVVLHLNSLYLKVPKLVDSLEDCKISFKEDVLKVIILTKNYTNNPDDFEFRDWILQLNNQIPPDLLMMMDQQYFQGENNISRDQLTVTYMRKLTRTFQDNLHKLVAYESEYESLFRKIIKLEDVLTSHSNNTELIFRLDAHRQLLPPKIDVVYHYYIRPIASRILSILLFVLSFGILESEFCHSTKLSLVNWVLRSFESHSFIQLLITQVLFSYMLFAALTSLTSLKIFNMYHLVPKNSDPVSTTWYAMYIARLTIPLSYNFITLFVSRKSVFEDWFGSSIHLTGLFNLLNNWLPRFVLLPVLLTLFNVYDRLKKRLGFTDFYSYWGFSDEEEDGIVSEDNTPSKRKDLIIVEAKRIIDRDISKRASEHNLRPFNLTRAANLNYENNRTNFLLGLARPYHDDTNLESDIDNSLNQLHDQPSVWDRINGTVNGIRDTIAGRFGSQGYRDDPLDFNFDADADAEQNLVI